MTYTVWDPHTVKALTRAGLARQQRSMLEGLLRLLSPKAYLSDHVSCANSAYLAVTRAQEALLGNAVGQPRLSLTRSLVATSLASVIAARPAFALGGAGDLDAARLLLQRVDATLDKHTTSQVKTAWAQQLSSLAQLIATAVRGWIAPLWDGSDIPAAVLRHAQGELAVAVSVANRDGRALREDLIRLLSAGRPDAAALTAVLWPQPCTYRVAMLVEGPRRLEQLELLLPGARQWPVAGDSGKLPPGSVRHTPGNARDAVTAANRGRRPATVVEIPVDAADAYTAIGHGRRQLSEALDQYAAAERLVDFTIGPRAVSTTPGRPVQEDSLLVSVDSAKPLTTHWPTALRPALRSAHLASQANAPMTSSALAWSAIDSMGLGSNDLDLLAKACALQTLRQQMIGLYQVVVESAAARVSHARWQVDLAGRVLGRRERAVPRVEQLGEVGRSRLEELRLLVEESRAQFEAYTAHLAQVENDVRSLFAVLQGLLLKGDLAQEPFNVTSRLLKLDRWLDALLPLTPIVSPEARTAHTAVGRLGALAGGLAADGLDIWRSRLADPAEMARWLDEQQEIYHALLAWLYATRNLAFHSGQFTGPADTLTAHAARGVVDMALEFLGNWHQEQDRRGEAGTDAVGIFRALAQRKDDLANELRHAPSCRPLNVDAITSLDSNGWDRP